MILLALNLVHVTRTEIILLKVLCRLLQIVLNLPQIFGRTLHMLLLHNKVQHKLELELHLLKVGRF